MKLPYVLVCGVLAACLLTAETLRVAAAVSSSRNAFEYLKALQKWKQATRRGLSCPSPAACTCHCDCGAPQFQTPPKVEAIACPMYPVYPTLPPPPTTPPPPPVEAVEEKASATPTVIPLPNCAAGEVARADGTCSPITKEVIEEMKALVMMKKRALDDTQAEYAGRLAHLCAKCQPPMATKLLHDHEEYRKALDLLLAMLAMMKEPTVDPAVEEAAAEAALGPEFVEGKVTGRVVCERWSGNATAPADKQTCGVICREEEACAGFAIDPVNNWCAWFKRLAPIPGKDDGCPVLETQYVKARNVTRNSDFWGSMQRIDAMEEQLETFMMTADIEAQEANATFVRWNTAFKGDNQTATDIYKSIFVGSKNAYTWTLQDSATIKAELSDAIQDTLGMISDEISNAAPFPNEEQEKAAAAAALAAQAAADATSTTTTTTTPRPLEWGDFPNSQDTQWSQRHPECPQGPPCYCNCKCAGAPPQNFVEPDPTPPTPCPLPPPTPPPSRLSLPGGAPSLR